MRLAPLALAALLAGTATVATRADDPMAAATPATQPAAAAKPAKPSLVAAQFAGKTVDSSGKALKVNPAAEYYVLYYGAEWCPPCRAFSPELVKWHEGLSPEQRKQVEVVHVNADRTPAEMQAYMKKNNMAFPGVAAKVAEKIPLVAKHSPDGIPCTVVLKPDGTLMASSYKDGQYQGPMAPLEELNAALASGM